MKKLMMTAVVSVSALFCEAASQMSLPMPRPMTPEEEKAAEEAELKRTGGEIYVPNSLKGEIVYVNCQTAAKEEWLKFSIDYFIYHTDFTIVLKPGKFDLLKPEVQGNVSLFVVDDPALPPILCAPESRWAMVNVAPLKSDKPAFFETRVKKELSRGFCYLCGATNSRYPKCLVGGITGLDMIDRQSDHRIQADVIQRFRTFMRDFGVTPRRYTAYINAVRQGWAPPPTNDYQKAVWDEVHKLPSNPIKIKFDPKRDK